VPAETESAEESSSFNRIQ